MSLIKIRDNHFFFIYDKIFIKRRRPKVVNKVYERIMKKRVNVLIYLSYTKNVFVNKQR